MAARRRLMHACMHYSAKNKKKMEVGVGCGWLGDIRSNKSQGGSGNKKDYLLPLAAGIR